ncbi:hypothetical protein AB0M38_31715 [Streptomyces sp. NPDC051742]|uniref:hypothetical protein n=1 Tax=unclassified Streptomyces TaxID=2593676 RepID=UPI003421FC86
MLATFHSGNHATLVQSSQTPGLAWWAMRETGGPYRIALLPACTVENGRWSTDATAADA